MHCINEHFSAGGMGPPGNLGYIENRPDGIRGQRAGHDPCSRREQLLQVFRMKAAILAEIPPDDLCAFALQRQPDGNVGFMVKIRNDDFTPLLQ